MKLTIKKTADQAMTKKEKKEAKDRFFRGFIVSYVETIFSGNAL